MNKRLARLLRNQCGVTLIELLVVVVILGIIAAVAIPMIADNQQKAIDNTNAQNLAILQDAVERYHIEKNRYPENLSDLVTEGFIRELPEIAGEDAGEFKVDKDSGEVTIE